MRVGILEIENVLKQYFYINKFDYNMFIHIEQLLELNTLIVDKTVDLIELIENIEDINTENKIDNIILMDFKDYIYDRYKINESRNKYIYASIPKLKRKVAYKKEDIINNPNIISIDKEMDDDVGCIKVRIKTIENEIIEKYVLDWKERNTSNGSKLLYVFGQCSPGGYDFNQKYIIKAQEYSK